jgi:hypothetical protein
VGVRVSPSAPLRKSRVCRDEICRPFFIGEEDSIRFRQSFDKSVCEGEPARKLYLDLGFTDLKNGGPNPAGVPTVIMQLETLKTN